MFRHFIYLFIFLGKVLFFGLTGLCGAINALAKQDGLFRSPKPKRTFYAPFRQILFVSGRMGHFSASFGLWVLTG